jgi:hypothetical protein
MADVQPGEGAPDLDTVLAAWPQALESFKPRLKAMAKEAQPTGYDGTTVLLGIPSKFQKVHLPTIQAEAGAVAESLGRVLGRAVRIKVVLDETVAGSQPPAEPPDEQVEDFREPQPSGERPRVHSPVSLAIEAFGATIESETVRE